MNKTSNQRVAKAALFYVLDGRYTAIPWMERSCECPGRTVYSDSTDGKEL